MAATDRSDAASGSEMTEQEKDAWMYEHGSVSGASNRDLPPVTDTLDAMADAMGMPPVAGSTSGCEMPNSDAASI